MAVVSRRRAARLEIEAAAAMGVEVVRVSRRAETGDGDQFFDILMKAGAVGIHDEIWAVRRQDTPFPSRIADRVMRGQIIERAVRRRNRFDIETPKKRSRPELRLRQFLGDNVINPIGVFIVESLVDAEDALHRMFEPQARRRSPKKRPMSRKNPPDFSPVRLDRRAVASRYSKRLESDALRIKHAKDVMIRFDEKRRRIGKGLILGEPSWVGMPVRRDDRHRLDATIKAARNCPCLMFDRQQTIRMKPHSSSSTINRVFYNDAPSN